MKRAFLVPILAMLMSATANASSISVTITPQPGSPVSLIHCTLQKEYVALARGVSVEGFRTGVVFKNTTSRPIVWVAFQFTMIDISGITIDSHSFKSTGTFAPSVEIDDIHWLDVDSWPTLGEMDCAVKRTLFADGTSWEST